MIGERQYPGIYAAKVVSNIDPTHQGLLSVQVPSVLGRAVLAGVRGCFPSGGPYSAPAVGATVWVMFEQGSPRSAVWLGVAAPVNTGEQNAFMVSLGFGG